MFSDAVLVAFLCGYVAGMIVMVILRAFFAGARGRRKGAKG